MSKENNPVRETDDEAIELAKQIVGDARYGGLGTLEPGTGHPIVSRIAVAMSATAGLCFLASDLSHHSKCLIEDPRCSLLLGEPGKGDGLAYPRITLIGETSRLPNDFPKRAELRAAFLDVHPKAELYIDFADFGFYPLRVNRALLNGGFGKAYLLEDNHLDFLRAG